MTRPKNRMTVREVAREFGTSPENVKPMTDRGEIPYSRIEDYVTGNGEAKQRYVYLWSGVTAFIDELHRERARELGRAS